jgi:DNA primase large subunit
MKKIGVFLFIFGLLFAQENNVTTKAEIKKEEVNLTKKNLEEQMKREAKYAKEKTFYQGKDYNLSERKIDPETISKIPTIKPEDDFNMDDVYSDIQ